MNNKNKIIMITSSIIMLIITIFGISYAYFTAITSGDKGSSIIIQTGSLKLLYEDTEYINVSNILPGTTFTKTIKVTNEGNVPVSYDLLWLDLNNTFENRNDLVMSIVCYSSTDSCDDYSETIIAYKGTNIPIMDHISIDGLEEHTYEVMITFKETGSNQDENQGKTLSGKLGILESDRYSSNEKIKKAKLVSINATYNNNETHTQGQVINKDDLVVNAIINDGISLTNIILDNDDYRINLQDDKVPNDATGTVPIKVTYNYNGTTKSNTFNVTTSGSGTYDYPSMYPSSTGYGDYKKIITQVDFVNNVDTNDSTYVWDIGTDQSSRILAWLDKSNLSHLYIGSESNQITMINGTDMFNDFTALKTINFNNMLDTSNATGMIFMFQNCGALTSLDLSTFDTSNVTMMVYMFDGCSSLTSLDVSSFDTSQVTNMFSMFSNCSALTSLDLSNFDTPLLGGGVFMFQNCSALTSLDLSNFDTSQVINMYSMFNNCSSLTSLDLSSFDTSNVADMSWMFYNCSSLTSLNLSNFDTSNVNIIGYMFYNCSDLTSLNLSSFDVSKVTNMAYMFYNCSSLTSLDLNNFVNTNTTTYMDFMFQNCTALKTIDLSGLTINDTTTNITDMFTGVTLNEQGSYAKNSTSAANLNTISNSNAFRVKS